MRIVFLGTPEFAVINLEKLLQIQTFNIVAIVTQPDKKRGRGNDMIPSPVKKLAVDHKISVWQPIKIKKDQNTIDNLKNMEADVFVVVAYGQILSHEILAIPKLGCINVHGSILPEYRGAAPIQWSIFNGDRQTGVTTMLMDKGMDTGAILLKEFTPISLLDNYYDLSEKLAKQGADLLVATLLKLEKGEIKPIPQDNEKATYARLINKSDYDINWAKSALEIHNQVRAFYPDCVTSFRNKSLKIMATLPIKESLEIELPLALNKLKLYAEELNNISGEIGEVIKIIKNLGLVIQTGEGLLLILEVQLAGKKVQSAWDFSNGNRIKVGEKLT
jgi:methionyl-tRNA formyltransferase